MSEELKNLGIKLETLTNKLNEVIACLSENELTRKIEVDYLEEEEKKEE